MSLAALGVCAACTTTYITTSGGAGDGGAGATPVTGGDGGASASGGDACSQFLACTAVVAPDTVDEAQLAYGPSGACFTTSDRETCLRACEQGLDAQRMIHPTEPACGAGASEPKDAGPSEPKDAGSCVAPDPCSSGVCGAVVDDCGRSVSCGGCGTGKYCEGNSCLTITSTYDCYANGSGAACSKNLQYCFLYINGPGGTYRSCKYSPAACNGTPTCACLRAQGTITASETCNEGVGPNGVGAIYVSYNALK